MPLLNTGPDRLDLTLTLSISIVGAWGGGGGGGRGGMQHLWLDEFVWSG